MTSDEQAMVTSARRKMALITAMVDHGEAICHGCIKDLFDLTVASPGMVVSFYLSAVDHIEFSDLSDEVKAVTRRAIQVQVQKLLQMVLEVVESDDPHGTLAKQGVTLGEMLVMGQGPSDEIH